MALATPPLREDLHVVCDWLELAVLVDEYYTYSFENLARAWDVSRNREDRDPEDGDDTDERFIESVKSEILQRIEVLGDAYPFSLSESGESLEFEGGACSVGGYVYLLCLLLSHPKAGPIFSGNYLPPINNAVRDFFQASATLAAAGYFAGNSYSFGFPRPDHTGFLEKLRIVYTHFGENVEVVAAVPAGASAHQKDAQIDVIAWAQPNDGAAGKQYLLGQVASGADWTAKTIKGGPIDSFHHVWFTRSPASMASPALFVPICYGDLCDGSNNDRVGIQCYEFGTIFYRFRVPVYAQKGFELAAAANDGLIVERANDIEGIRVWISDQITKIREASVAA